MATRRDGPAGCGGGPGRSGSARASGAGAPPRGPSRARAPCAPRSATAPRRRRGGRGRHRGSGPAGPRFGWPIHVGPCTPLVMPRIRWSLMPVQVALAVWAWRWLTALAPFVSRRLNAVMSNWVRSPSIPSPSSSTRSTGTPPRSRKGPAIRRTSSASKRSLPAETGVWIVNTLFRRTADQASSMARPLATSSPARSASRSAEWPSLRCQTAGARPECPDRPDAADAEDQLLVEPHLATAHVQDVGDRTVRLEVLGQVGVEEQHRHPADLGQPDRHVEFAVRAARRSRSAAARSGPGPVRAAAGERS